MISGFVQDSSDNVTCLYVFSHASFEEVCAELGCFSTGVFVSVITQIRPLVPFVINPPVL